MGRNISDYYTIFSISNTEKFLNVDQSEFQWLDFILILDTSFKFITWFNMILEFFALDWMVKYFESTNNNNIILSEDKWEVFLARLQYLRFECV